MESSLLTDTEKNMAAQGVAPDEPAFDDYFGFSETNKWYFPDGKQFISFQLMNEGARSRYQAKTSQDVRLFKTTGDASIKMDASKERRILVEESVIGWYVIRDGDPVPFDSTKPGSVFMQWYEKANPKFVSDLELAIRKANPWMQAEMTVELIDEEIANLRSMREDAVKREEGKSGS